MRKHLLAVIAIGAGIGLAPPKANATVSATLNEFTGADAQISVQIGAAANAGDLQFTLTRVGPATGDITGFWANLNGSSQTTLFNAGGLTVSGSTVASSEFSADSVNNLGNGVNLTGGGSPSPLDFGVRFSKPGDGSQGTVVFTLHANQPLSESLFADATFGARIQAINGSASDTGEGSSKLSGSGGTVPGQSIPDSSSTVTLLGVSLCGIEWLRRRLRM